MLVSCQTGSAHPGSTSEIKIPTEITPIIPISVVASSCPATPTPVLGTSRAAQWCRICRVRRAHDASFGRFEHRNRVQHPGREMHPLAAQTQLDSLHAVFLRLQEPSETC